MSQNQIITLTSEQINNRVNAKGGNTFTKAEMALYRAEISKARAARKARLGNMSIATITAFATDLMEQGYVLEKHVDKAYKSKDSSTLVFSRSKGTRALKETNETLKNEVEELKAQIKALLEAKMAGFKDAVTA